MEKIIKALKKLKDIFLTPNSIKRSPEKPQEVKKESPGPSPKFKIKKMFVDAKVGLNMRSTPELLQEKNRNFICQIQHGQEVLVLNKQKEWFKIKYLNKEGWVVCAGLAEKSPIKRNAKSINSEQKDKLDEQVDIKKDTKHPIKLKHKKYYGPDSIEANIIREYIGDIFGGKRKRYDLQCTEYAYYRLLCADIRVEWQRTSGRHGGLWPEVVSKKYKVSLDTPVEGGVICLPLSVIPNTGHVAYIEKVNSDLSINIAEANWGFNSEDIGRYWERTLPLKNGKTNIKQSLLIFHKNLIN